jgi:hypothetical protein
MTGMHALWIPIVLSAAAIFVVSSIIHMMLDKLIPWHKNDYSKVPQQDAVMAALRPFAIPPGDYLLPRPDTMEDMRTPEFMEKVNKGPKVVMTVMPNGIGSMGRSLGLWFLYLLGVNVFAAYVTGRALPPGAEYLAVFRFVGTTAFLGFAAALWQGWIWFQRSLGTTIRSTIDGLIFALIAGGIFGYFWPR